MEQAISEYLSEIEVKFLTHGIGALTPVERESFANTAHAAKLRMDAYFRQYELGLLDDDFYNYYFLPTLAFWRPRWIQLDMVSASTTRPSFKRLIDSLGVE